jgi:predicted RNase H-like nuclease
MKSSKCIRGEELVQKLSTQEVHHDPTLTNKRCCFEVYPHPATIRLFGLEKTLKYKPRQNRSYQERYTAFQVYQQHLKSLDITGVDELLSRDVTQMIGKALKDYEDTLDALLCAYIAKDLDQRGSDMYGNEMEGYILVPSQL